MKFKVRIVEDPDSKEEAVVAIAICPGSPTVVISKEIIMDFLEKTESQSKTKVTWKNFTQSGPSHQSIIVEAYLNNAIKKVVSGIDNVEDFLKSVSKQIEFVDKKLQGYMATGNVKGGVSQGVKNDLLSAKALKVKLS
jgi:hypothetical protein